MSELVKCIIASHKRPKGCVTAKNIANTSICVPDSQAKDYAKNYPNSEIIAHPDSVVGLSSKFRWIHNKFKNVAIMDDDIFLRRMWIEPKDLLGANVDPETAYDIIQQTAQVAKDMGVLLFGYGKEPVPVAYSGHEPFRLSGFVIGGVMGFFEGFQMNELPDKCVAATDFFISCLNAYHNRFTFIDNRYFTASKEGTFHSVGGMSDFRTVNTEKNDLMLLIENFGEVVVLKKTNPLRKLQHQYERTLQLPY